MILRRARVWQFNRRCSGSPRGIDCKIYVRTRTSFIVRRRACARGVTSASEFRQKKEMWKHRNVIILRSRYTRRPRRRFRPRIGKSRAAVSDARYVCDTRTRRHASRKRRARPDRRWTVISLFRTYGPSSAAAGLLRGSPAPDWRFPDLPRGHRRARSSSGRGASRHSPRLRYSAEHAHTTRTLTLLYWLTRTHARTRT